MEVNEYLENTSVSALLRELGAKNRRLLLKNVDHFTKKSGDWDRVTLGRYGESGVEAITDAIVDRLISPPKLKGDAEILDVGVGTGFFTLEVVRKVRQHLPSASFYGMDLTPAMLMALRKKSKQVLPFLGIVEDIEKSIEVAGRYLDLPDQFDAVISTLTLHHCPDLVRVLESIKEVLRRGGKAVIVDLAKHPHKDFERRMIDVHTGFDPHKLESIASKSFGEVKVEKLVAVCCEESGESAEILVATMH